MEATLVNKETANTFFLNEVMDSNPKQLLLKIYDYALTGCEERDMLKTNNAISELISALNFETEETSKISVDLLRLYQYCQEEARKGNYEIVGQILTGLKESWQTIFTAN